MIFARYTCITALLHTILGVSFLCLMTGCKSSPDSTGGEFDSFLTSSIPADTGALLYSNYSNDGMLALRSLYPKDAVANPFSAGIASLGDKNPDLAKSLETLLSMAPGSLLEQDPTIQKMVWFLSPSSVLTGVLQFKDEASITKARQALLDLKLQNIACTEATSSPQALLCTLTKSASDKAAEPVAPTSIAICTKSTRIAVVVDGNAITSQVRACVHAWRALRATTP